MGRHLAGRLEPETLQQHGVGHEAQKMLEVLRATIDQIPHGLVEQRAANAGQRRQLRVGHGLTGEGQERDGTAQALGPQRIETGLPRPAAP